MRIAIISDLTNFSWAGCEELWSALAMSALREGHSVAFFQTRSHMPEHKLKALLEAGLQLMRPSRGQRMVDRIRTKVSWKLASLLSHLLAPFSGLDGYAPDIIFFNSGDALPAPEFLHNIERSGALRFPYVIACHNSYLFGAPPSDDVRVRAARYYLGAREVFFVAERTCRETQHLLAITLPRTTIVRNPVNLANLTEIPMAGGPAVRMASLGRLAIHSKGQDVLLAVLGSDRFLPLDWRLSIYGEGPHLDYLTSLAKHYRISEKVRFCGQVQDIRAVWEENHILLLPSRNESAPLVLVEAMLCGRPSVVSGVGGVSEWISEPETGFISQGMSIESFEQALLRAFDRLEEWTMIGERARARALAMIDPDPGGTLLQLLLKIHQAGGGHAGQKGSKNNAAT